MQFYFIRHAQSENNRLWAETGSDQWRDQDPALSEVGEQQAQHLAEFLARPGGQSALPPEYDGQNVTGFDFTHLYCSLMVRSVATGVAISRAMGVPLVAWQDLHEVGGIHLTDWDTGERRGLAGKDRAYFEAEYPELGLPSTWHDSGWWNRPFEEDEERPARAKRFLQELLSRHGGTDDRVAAISHGGFYNHLVRAILKLPDTGDEWFAINNTGITRIDLDGSSIWLQYTNRVDHLPGELIT